MLIPDHYQLFYRRFIRFACWMVFFALLSGILFQESTRKIPMGEFPPGIHWEAVYHLALLHGHAFLIGTLIPLAVLAMLQFGLLLGGKEISGKVLTWGGWLYLLGAFLSITLMLYKGYHYVLSIRFGELDFAVIHHGLFGGLEMGRHLVYGVSHVGMSVGLIILVVGVLRSLPKSSQVAT
ncbi:MAG: DUF2871 family protein [Vampirovibrio sp.]|nr:DUF2871 family protein [Vampirovibrio sp.]